MATEPETEPLTLFDIVPGKRLGGHYTVVGPHRQGGFSTAFQVMDDELGVPCELQLFPAALFDGETQVRDFIEGLRPWTEIDSPSVVPVLEVLEVAKDTMAVVTGFPGGESLRVRLDEGGARPQAEVLGLGRRMLEGLVAIHARKLVHGDIKPHNVHVSGTGAAVEARLVDGGVTHGLWQAKDLGNKTALIGTPYYAPFEQFGGDAPDVRSDIYNVAVVLFECATGVLPWKATNFLEVFQAKLKDPPPMAVRAPDVPVDAALEEVVRRGCLADRNDRYGSAREFLDALRALE